MKKKIHINSLFVKIFSTVIIGIVCLSVSLSMLNLFISKEVFAESFSDSQQKAFKQIDSDFYDFFSLVTDVATRANTSWAVREYLTAEYQTPEEEMKTIYYMQNHMNETRLGEHSELNVMLVGFNGKSHFVNSSKRNVPFDEILEGNAAKKALEHPDKLICEYEKGGYTDNQKNSPVLIMAKTLSYGEADQYDGIIFLSIKETDFEKMYEHFTSATNDIIILNQDEEVVSSNERGYLTGEKQEELEYILAKVETEESKLEEVKDKSRGNVEMYLTQKLQGTNFRMLGIINPNIAFQQQYDIKNNILLTLVITLLIGFFIFVFIRQQTKPLSKLADKMRVVQKGNMQEYVEVEGTEEIQELSKTYNTMLQRINHYIEEKMQIQEEKRNAEIHALQMQINPHYMYNTLASIKWLIWQGDTAKSTAVIDAFISLLRNTISNTDEFVSVEQEIENLRNYTLINQTRYGDAVSVEFYVSDSCRDCLVPKLILQPFVENAFFHAFPEGMTGEISVFVKEERHYLRFDIMDNGIGMGTETLSALRSKKDKKSEHFTGIGINNVDDRIKLIYGMDYGINIVSEEEKGTTITILLPRREKGNGDSV